VIEWQREREVKHAAAACRSLVYAHIFKKLLL